MSPPSRPSSVVVFLSLALVVASESVFASVFPTVLGDRMGGNDLVVGAVVGSALGLGLLGVPLAVPWLRRGRSVVVLRCCSLLLATAGPACLVGAQAPVVGILFAGVAFGTGRAIAVLVLLSEVGRLGSDSAGQGYNSAAQRFGAAAGGLLAGWSISHGRADVAAASVGGAAVLLLILTGRRARSVSTAPRESPTPQESAPQAWATAWRLVVRDRTIQASLMLNVSVWIGIFIGNTMLPIAFLRVGLAREEVGDRVLVALVVRDLTSVVVGVGIWRLVRKLSVPVLVLGIGGGNAVAAVTVVVGDFSVPSVVFAAVLTGTATACGISCANVMATRGSGSQVELRLAASQAMTALPIALVSGILVASVGRLGGSGALLASGGVAVAVAGLAALVSRAAPDPAASFSVARRRGAC